MFLLVALKAINHVLAAEDWPLQRLKPFAGQSLRIELGRFEMPVKIDANGLLVDGTSGDSSGTEPPAVTITLPADAPARLILDRTALVGATQISGSAELAECLSFVFKNLRWDPEHDLAQKVGDIAARRIVEGGKWFAGWQTDQIRNLASNLIDFLAVEQPTLVRQADAAHFASAVTQTQSAVEQLETRIATLERLK